MQKNRITLSAAMLLVAGTAASGQTLYSTSFEAPTYPVGMSVAGIDGWANGSGTGNSQSVSDTRASEGTQSLLWDNTSLLSFYSVRRELPMIADEVTASVDLWIPSTTEANRVYGIYFTSSATGTLGSTSLGLTISGDGSLRGGPAWSNTYTNSGLFHVLDPGVHLDRWITLTLTWDPATGDGTVGVSGLGGSTPVVGAFVTGVSTPLGLNLGTDYFGTGDRMGTSFMDNLVISEVPGVTGACCLPDGSCDEVREVVCIAQSGTYHGDNTSCATTPTGGCPQPPTGACCLDGSACIVVWEPGCLDQGGIYQGDGSDCATAQCPLMLSTSYDGTLTATVSGAGAFFDVTALDPQGIVIDEFQMNSQAAAGTPITVHVYVKEGSFAGYESDASAWVLLGQTETVAAGHGQRTAVPIGGLHIAQNETWGIRLGTQNGGHRYNSEATTVAFHADSHAQITLGRMQNNFFGSPLSGTRGWNGTVVYSLGANVTTGACCFEDGSCQELREIICTGTGGVYHGDNTTCATTSCPQPGACCLPASCAELIETRCTEFSGDFKGENTTCASTTCPVKVGNLIGFNWTTSASATPDPQNWTRISAADGFLSNVNDDTGTPTNVNISWAGGATGGFFFLSTSTLAPDAAPQHQYDLSGMTGYGYRSGGEFTVELSGLTPDNEYQYWFVGYRGSGAIDNLVQVSAGDVPNAITFNQFITSGDNNGRFLVNETNASSATLWDVLARTTTSSSTGTITFNWSGQTQTTVIGALAIREILDDPCYADCNNDDLLNIADFLCFIDEFAVAQTLPPAQQQGHYANCTGATSEPFLTVADFLCFIDEFAQGCP